MAALPVSAQEVATSFEDLQRVIKPGDTITVTDQIGATIKGTLAALSASTLELRVQRDPLVPALHFQERDINNIVRRRHDPLWNGMLIGFASGAIPSTALFLASGTPFTPDDGAAILGMSGIGLVTGLLIDLFSTERVTLYVRAPRAAAVSLKF